MLDSFHESLRFLDRTIVRLKTIVLQLFPFNIDILLLHKHGSKSPSEDALPNQSEHEA